MNTQDPFDPLFERESMDDVYTSEEQRPYIPCLWRPAKEVDASTPGRGGVPTIDDDLDTDPDAAPRSYDAWTRSETMVVSGPVGSWAKTNPGQVGYHGKGQPYDTRSESRKGTLAKFGAILETYRLPNRYCYRVFIPRKV